MRDDDDLQQILDQDDLLDEEDDQQEKKSFGDQLKQKRLSKQFYVNGQELVNQIRKYQQSKKTSPDGIGIISQELGSMILKICTRFSLHPRFFNYTFRQQMIADAILRCISKGLDHINLELSNCNPFSYFTQIAFNCFRTRISIQKKFTQTRNRYRDIYYNQFQLAEGLKPKGNDDDSQIGVDPSTADDDQDTFFY